MRIRDYERNFGKSNIRKCGEIMKLTSVSGHKLEIVGKVKMRVNKLNDKKDYFLEIILINSVKSFIPLIGRCWLDILSPNWRLSLVNKITSSGENSMGKIIVGHIKYIKEMYSDIFKSSLEEPIVKYEARVKLKEGAQPIFCRAYEVPFKIREKVCLEIDRLVKEGVLIPVKYSDWASPLVVVPKANNTIRLCMDCKVSLNKVIETEHYPLPKISDVFVEIANCNFYCKFDLTGAYQQIRVAEDSIKYLTVNTIKGLFSYTRLPFGISSASSIFQQTMDEILKGCKKVGCFLDDIIVGGKTIEELYENTIVVLNRLKEYKVKVNEQKCQFFVKEVEYLGHKISGEGISPNPRKLEAIMKAPRPGNITQLRAYLGLVNFYSKFVPHLSIKMSILYELLKKEKDFEWTKECQTVFDESKQLICSERVLAHYDPSKELVVLCDASSYGLGAVLCIKENNVERPVIFLSSTLSDAEKKYPNIHREALCMVFATKRFHKYIYGHKFSIITDCRPLVSIFNFKKGIPPLIAGRLQRYAYSLSIYDFEIKYRKGETMYEADCLSRLPIKGETGIKISSEINLKTINEELPINFDEIERVTKQDIYLQQLYIYVRDGWGVNIDQRYKQYYTHNAVLSIHGDCLLYNERVIIPAILRLKILHILHSSHLGLSKMKNLARRYIYWPKLDHDIEQFVKSCDSCASTGKMKKQVFNNWECSKFPFERVHLDFFHLKGNTYLIFVDSFSKWIEIKLMGKTNAQCLIATLGSIFAYFGRPHKIVCDNGPPFNSIEFKIYCNERLIDLTHSPPYHPQSNGQAERAVQTVKNGLKKLLVDNNFRDWNMSSIIHKFLFDVRNSYSESIKCTPSERILKFNPRKTIDSVLPVFSEVKEKFCCNKRNKNIEKEKDIETIYNNTNINKEKISTKNYEFKIDDRIWYRSYDNNGLYKWLKAKVVSRKSGYTYIIDLNGTIKLAHLNQIKLRLERKEIYIDPCNDSSFKKRKRYSPKSLKIIAKKRRTGRKRNKPNRLNYSKF